MVCNLEGCGEKKFPPLVEEPKSSYCGETFRGKTKVLSSSCGKFKKGLFYAQIPSSCRTPVKTVVFGPQNLKEPNYLLPEIK